MNTYGQFDVSKAGAILNNSPVIVKTQLGGQINGNGNISPGQSAKIIVNQVNSNNPSQLRGSVEVAGTRAEVVIANSAGLVVNGGGFINTSRAILTTGTPVIGANGGLTGFDVTGGRITVEGTGLNAADIDQVDLIARAVQANAAIHANTLNVVAGANHVDHDTLAATPITGTDAAPSIAIDVSALGGMYANRIYLASNEYGVGVSNAGVLAAQAGDLTLAANGRLSLAGKTSASGNLSVSATGGVHNTGTTYARQNTTVSTAADVANSGTLAALGNTTVNAGSVNSTGTLGAGLNDNDAVAGSGSLSVTATGALSATGNNAAGGNASLTGAGVNLAGSRTSANGTLTLDAGAGDLNLASATTTAGGALNATTGGTLTNDSGILSSTGAQTIHAGAVSNVNGQILSQSTLDIAGTSAGGNTGTGALNNRQGVIQAASTENIHAASLDNTAGSVTTLGTAPGNSTLTLTTDGTLVNAGGTTVTGKTGGVIGSSGDLSVTAGALSNQAQITSTGIATVKARSLDNHAGSIEADGNLGVTIAGTLANQHGMLSGAATKVSAASVDNSSGTIEGDGLSLSTTTGDLINRSGTIRQYSNAAQTLSAAGTLDNTGGTVTSRASDLTVSAQTLINDSGSIQHTGAGKLAVTMPGALSNVNGKVTTNGTLDTQSASLDNTGGTLSAQHAATLNATTGLINHGGTIYGHDGLIATTQGAFDNSAGSAQTDGNLSVTAGGALSNGKGTFSANGAHGTVNVSAASIDNTSGKLTNGGDGATTLTAATDIVNTGGTLGGNGDVTVKAQTLTNNAGAQLVARGAALLNVAQRVNNSGGRIYGGTALNLNQPGAAVTNDGGQIEGGQDVSVQVASLSNANGSIKANRDIAVGGAGGSTVTGDGQMTSGRNLTMTVAGDYTNGVANSLHADGNLTLSATGTLTNSGTLAAGSALTASGANVVNQAGADINGTTTTVSATGTLTNAGRIEGNSVTTNSATLANTGSVIGNTVQVNAADVSNSGAAAVIAAAQNLAIYASNSVTNEGGALIYSGGNLQIAKDGTRNASGLLADQMNTLTNSASNIEAVGDIDIAAHTVNNLRTGAITKAGTPQVTGTKTLTLWSADLDPADRLMGYYASGLYPEWNWHDGAIGFGVIGHLAKPISVTVPKSQVTNLNPSAQTFSLTQPLTDEYYPPLADSTATPVGITRTITNNATQYYNSITDNGSTYTITLWPDFDPNKNIRPDDVKVRTDLGTDNHDYVERSRTVTTTTTTDQLVNPGTGATMRAQGAIRINADGGSINNEASTMVAGRDLTRVAAGGGAHDDGIQLMQSVTQDSQSTYYWHQKTGGSNDTKTVDNGITTQTTPVASLLAVATANGAVQTSAQDITVSSVNLVGQTVNGSGVTGGDATGVQLGDPSGQRHRPQTLGSAAGGIPGLKLPVNGLYTYQPAPNATYLIETDPRFTSYSRFISSDYMLGALGLNPQATEKRLGDGMYEEQLVMNQVTQLTGRTFLTGYTDNMGEYTALMNNGVSYGKSFNLTPGIGLSDAQMQQLTTDMVWIVSQDVTLPDGTHQSVLVPKLYLAQANTVDLQDSGAIVAGNSVSLNATGNVNNTGHIVGDVATAVLGNNIVNGGVIGSGTDSSGGTTVVAAVQDVRNTSGRIGGRNTVVQAGRDVIDETQTTSVSNTLHEDGFTASASSQGTNATGTISASNNAVVLAGRDVTLTAASIQAGGDATVGAGRNITAGTTTLTSTQDAGTNDGLNGGHTSTTQNVGSSITAGGNLATVSGGNTTLTDTTVKAGKDAALIAGNDLTVTAALDTNSHNEQSLGGPGAKHTGSSYDERVQGSNLNAGNNLTLGAGQTATAGALLSQYGVSRAADASTGSGNLSLLGSSATTGTTQADGTMSGGKTTLAATGNVNIGAANETHDSQHWEQVNHSGFLSSDKNTDQTTSHQVNAVGSTVAGDSLAANAGHDLNIAGSTVASTHDMALSAGHDLNVTTTQDTSNSSHFHEEQKSGFGALGGGGVSVNYGTSDKKDTTHDSSLTQNGSTVGSTNGSVSMTAGNNLHITGSDVIAAQDVTGKAANVIIDSATGTTHHDETHEMKTSGFTLGLSGSVGDAINGAVQQTEAISNGGGDGRAKALHGIAAAGDAAIGVAGATGGALAGGSPSIGVQLSFGTTQSKSTSSEDQTTQTGSGVKAGGTASFTATGNGTPGSGNITIAGSDVSANDVALTAKNQVNLVNSTNTDSTRSTNKSSSASFGVSFGTQGFGVSAAMSNAHGDANSDAVIQNNTHVTAANNVSIVSGGDTNVVGADVNGKHVTADVGGNLNIASVQDTTVSTAHQSSTSGGFSISQGGGSASFSSQNGHADANYAGVTEQAGIQAGSGGFDINVKGNTDLKGAYIASTADASQNSLTTGTLTTSDIQDHSHYSAASSGFSAGAGVGVTGKATGPGSVGGTGGVVPMLFLDSNGDESATTRSGISAGTITVTDQANQKQDVASVNRDTSNLNGTVSKAPDVNHILTQQADLMNAAQAAGQVVAQSIGSYADMKEKQAQQAVDAAKLAGQTDLQAQYQAEADSWAEGGANRVALHVGGGALIAGLGGGGIGSALQGAAGAGVSATLAGKLNGLASTIGSETGSSLAGNIVSNVLAGIGGAVVGGSAGAFTASNADLYNRQLHPDERQWAKDKAAAFAKYYEDTTGRTITVDEAQQMLLSNGYIRVDAKAASGPGYDATAAQFITQNAGGLFTATPTERANPGVLGGPLTPEQRALPGSVATPGAGLAAAVVLTGGLALGPETVAAAAAAVQACVANPVLCLNQVGIAAGEFVAGNAMPAGTGAAIAAAAAASKLNNFHRDDDLTTGLVRAETINQQFIEQGYSAPFTSGTYVTVNKAGTGAPANMVVTSGQATAIADGKPALGAFSTPDVVPSQQYVRETMAVTPAMKPDVSMVQPVQTTGKPLVTVEGKIAPQSPANQFPGGGNQTFYDYPAAGSRTDYVSPLGPAQSLPPH